MKKKKRKKKKKEKKKDSPATYKLLAVITFWKPKRRTFTRKVLFNTIPTPPPRQLLNLQHDPTSYMYLLRVLNMYINLAETKKSFRCGYLLDISRLRSLMNFRK